ncbi:MAG: hypothetical protein R2806_08625 [Saprospiraceae bacterium]
MEYPVLNRHLPYLFFVFLTWSLPISGQQPASPLVKSFDEYQKMKADGLYGLTWVSLGPVVNSARADLVQIDPTDPATMYAGFGSGGLWKTVNHGLDWFPIFENKAALGIGDVALAPSNPQIIYLGTGEHLKKPRNFTLPGNGMYRSDDGGATWSYLGLEDSWAIAEIAVHPTNPDIVMVCVLGHLWSANRHRGLYRTIDGGKNWEQVLYLDDHTGANDIVISPTHPNRMYATMWEVYPGISGRQSGVYHSEDTGKTWTRSTAGLPENDQIGRIGLAVSAQNPDKVYALMDNLNNAREEAAELYRSNDGGAHWVKTHDGPFMIFPGIGWYFTDVYVNPTDDDDVYCLGVRLARSQDGGKTFTYLGGTVQHMNPSRAQGLHLDQCELWIDPHRPEHLALGNDGGLYVSYDAGNSWMHYNNIPVGEFYDLTIDQKHGMIFGGTQDDATVFGPAAEFKPHFPDPWQYIWIDPWDGGDGCVSQIDPDDDCILYYSMQHGEAIRYDRCVDSTYGIKPALPDSIQDTLNFNYITPYFVSPHRSSTIYHGGNYVFKSNDRGTTWKVISPNLTRSVLSEKRSFALGALVESPVHAGWLYAGTDKGAFWVTNDDGKHWVEHSSGLANNYIRCISPSKFQHQRIYLAMTGLNYDDLGSYLYRSEDNGLHWQSIRNGLPDEPVNVVMEDPRHEDLLYAGTARGVYISGDRGEHWSLLGEGLPAAAIADMDVLLESMDLVIATHGRGIYKLNLRPIQEMFDLQISPQENHLFAIPAATRPWFNAQGGEVDQRTIHKTSICFWLHQSQPVKLRLFDHENQLIWEKTMDGHPGYNEYRWDLVIREVNSDLPYFVHYQRYLAAGEYQMQLTMDDQIVGQQRWHVKEALSPYARK